MGVSGPCSTTATKTCRVQPFGNWLHVTSACAAMFVFACPVHPLPEQMLWHAACGRGGLASGARAWRERGRLRPWRRRAVCYDTRPCKRGGAAASFFQGLASCGRQGAASIEFVCEEKLSSQIRSAAASTRGEVFGIAARGSDGIRTLQCGA